MIEWKRIKTEELDTYDLFDRKLKFLDLIGISYGNSIALGLFLGRQRVHYLSTESQTTVADGNMEYVYLNSYVATNLKQSGKIYPDRILTYENYRLIRLNPEELPKEKKDIYNDLFKMLKDRE